MDAALTKILDDNAKMFNGFSISCIKCPDVTLRDYHRELIAAMISITISGFDVASKGPSPDVIYKHFLCDQSYLWIVRKDGEMVGFRAVRHVEEFDLIWLTGIVVKSGCKKYGIAKFCLEEAIKITNCSVIACSTQSPIVYRLVRSISKKIYPDLDIAEIIPKKYQEMGEVLMEKRRGSFDKSSFVSTGLYPHCLYPDFPWVKEDEINDFFRNNLDFGDGKSTRDGFLLIGILRDETK